MRPTERRWVVWYTQIPHRVYSNKLSTIMGHVSEGLAAYRNVFVVDTEKEMVYEFNCFKDSISVRKMKKGNTWQIKAEEIGIRNGDDS